jgi:hypothetical protein
MKKFNLLMAALMLFAVSFVACNNDDVDKGGNNNDPQEPAKDVTFTIADVEATLSDVTFTVTPSDNEADYLVFVHDAKSVEECETNDDIIYKIYSEIEEFAAASDTTLNDYLAGKVKRGVLESVKVGNLAYNTNYYILVFAVDAANNYAATSDLEMKRFKTTEPEVSSCTFEIAPSVYLTSVSLKVTPSVSTQTWHLINLPVSEYQKYTNADGEYGWSQQEFFQNYLNTEIEELKSKGLSNEEIGIKLIHTGLRTLNDSGLNAKTKYVALAGAVNYTNGAAYLTSTLKEVRYNSGEAAENDLSFEVDVYNIDHYSADIKITPSDLNAEYYYYIGYIDGSKKSLKPVEIANAAVTEYIYYWENYTELKHRDPVKGIVDLTGDNKYQLDIAETEYFIVAFSFVPNPTYGTVIDEENGTYDSNPGTITSTPVYVSFKTPNHGDASKAEFQFNFSDCGPYDFTLEMTNNDPTVYYLPGVAFASNFSEQAVMSAYEASLAQIMQMCMEGQNPCLTYQEALEKLQAQGYSYRNGNANFYIANLTPETSFIAFALAIDITTGKFVKCYYSDVVSTTAVGSVNPSIEILGIYDGNEENGTIFGNAALTEDTPIVAIKYNNLENASKLFTAISKDAYDDVKNTSDQLIIALYHGYWNEVNNIASPYEFFFAVWDTEHTAYAYAQDANGAEGQVARTGFKPQTAGDIEELRGYVEAHNNALKSAISKSMVVAPQSEPTMECVWSEAVGAPRSAEVTYHKVESIASDLVRVKVIKSFHI